MSAKNRSFVTALWDFFCSLKLTIITLILLAITSIIGTVVQQNLPTQEYLKVYGETTYKVLHSLQFFDMYHSWWFLGLLGIFTINLLACSIKRLPRVWKTVNEPVLTPEDTLYRTLSNFEEVVVKNKTTEQVKEEVATLLGKKFAAPTVTEEEGKIHLFAQKMPWARFGVYVTHLSIIIIFIGAIIGTFWGYKAFVNIVEGTATDQVWPRRGQEPINLGFSVRCDDFEVTFYDGTGRPKDFKSDLVVLENGKEVLKKTIEVNDPLTYKGITFYQSSYGPTGEPLFKLQVADKATGQAKEYTARQGQRVLLPDGSAFRVADYTQSFQQFGPAARIEVFPPEGKMRSFVVLEKFPQFDAQRGGDHVFSLVNAEQRYYTGLQVAKDPGVWTVWIGCFMLVAGTLIAFFLSHRRIWITVQSVDDKVGVKLGGSAHRNQPAFEIFFDELKQAIKERLKG